MSSTSDPVVLLESRTAVLRNTEQLVDGTLDYPLNKHIWRLPPLICLLDKIESNVAGVNLNLEDICFWEVTSDLMWRKLQRSCLPKDVVDPQRKAKKICFMENFWNPEPLEESWWCSL